MREIKFKYILIPPKDWKDIGHKDETIYLKLDDMQINLLTYDNVSEDYEKLSHAVDNKFEIIRYEYTGLKDKNGKEIYEGDIIKYEGEIIEYIIYESGSFKGQWHNKKYKVCTYAKILRSYFPNPYEVIGNIYKDPELIK